jgi:hypothetical protein
MTFFCSVRSRFVQTKNRFQLKKLYTTITNHSEDWKKGTKANLFVSLGFVVVTTLGWRGDFAAQ